MNFSQAKIALVFDWMTTPGGAEKVNLLLHEIFPEAPIYTSIFNPPNFPALKDATVHTSFIQNLPFAKQKHQYFLPLMPYAYEQFDLDEYDIVLSSSHSCAKGIITRPETLHVSYCHSPMRYAWDEWHRYIREYPMNPILKYYAKKRLHKIRLWDRLAAERVDHYIANSSLTQARIEKYYRKPSHIITPMVTSQDYQRTTHPKDYFLAVGRLIPYKRFDLIIEAFNKNGLPLKIVGTGAAEAELRRTAHKNIEFLGYLDDESIKKLYSECQALIFPQKEDFGITALEAMASGRPVIAYEAGGALDTIQEGKTGIFFKTQTSRALNLAITHYLDQKNHFIPSEIQKHAMKFDTKHFQKNLLTHLEMLWQEWQKKLQTG